MLCRNAAKQINESWMVSDIVALCRFNDKNGLLKKNKNTDILKELEFFFQFFSVWNSDCRCDIQNSNIYFKYYPITKLWLASTQC